MSTFAVFEAPADPEAAPTSASDQVAAAGMRHGAIVGQTPDGVDGYNCNYDHNPLESDPDYDRLSYIEDRRGKMHHAGSKWQVQLIVCVFYVEVQNIGTV